MLLYGPEPTLPLDVQYTIPPDCPATIREHLSLLISQLETLRDLSIQNLAKHRDQMKIQSDKSIFIKDFTVGDVVYVYTPAVKHVQKTVYALDWTIFVSAKSVRCFI